MNGNLNSDQCNDAQLVDMGLMGGAEERMFRAMREEQQEYRECCFDERMGMDLALMRLARHAMWSTYELVPGTGEALRYGGSDLDEQKWFVCICMNMS